MSEELNATNNYADCPVYDMRCELPSCVAGDLICRKQSFPSETGASVSEAVAFLKEMADFAYKQGLHEVGYDPVLILVRELAIRQDRAEAAESALVTAVLAEREACAEIADEYYSSDSRNMAEVIADEIRARKEGQ